MSTLCICGKASEFLPYIIYKNESVFSTYEGITIGKCPFCGILKSFHPRDSKLFNPTITKYIDYEKQKEEFEELFSPIVQAIQMCVPKGGRVLDVGCSSGILLQLLDKQGYKITGVEPNKQAYTFAHSRLGSRVTQGIITDLSSTKQFDCIIYNHVLEHIEDISTEISEIKKRLKKNGILIIGVPNTDNVIFKLRKKYWEYLLPNEHVWHFNTKLLIKFFKKHNFKVLELSFVNDKRKDYPPIKRFYFYLLSLIDKLLSTGEAVLIIIRKAS